MTDYWADPDWIRDEAEANPPPDPYEVERLRLRAEDARLTREMAERGYRYVPDSVLALAPVSYLRCAVCGKRLGDYGDCDACAYDESEARR